MIYMFYTFMKPNFVRIQFKKDALARLTDPSTIHQSYISSESLITDDSKILEQQKENIADICRQLWGA